MGEVAFVKGDIIVTQGDIGSRFFIVAEGVLSALRKKPGENESQKLLKQYKAGDHFGELALLHNEPRRATVIVQSESAKLLVMKEDMFNYMVVPKFYDRDTTVMYK